MKIGGKIREWYKKNKRQLPWRDITDPYRVWISEIILQQTRVNQGLEYYLRFIAAFPDVDALARAEEDEVLKLWQGLGYYNRARNLHRGAKAIVNDRGGKLPASYEEWLSVKGVGTYTASAIASVCFGEPRAVVDGNVSRVIARIFGIEEAVNSSAGEKQVTALAGELMDPLDPGTHNQAMMEFGAMQCIPASPDCMACPVMEECVAFRNGKVDRLPAKIPKKKPVDRYIYYYVMTRGPESMLVRRGNGDIWRSLYQFPAVESAAELSEEELLGPRLKEMLKNVPAKNITVRKVSDPVRHQLTHRTVFARFIHLETRGWPRPLPGGWIPILKDQLNDYPVPRLINRYMEVVNF